MVSVCVDVPSITMINVVSELAFVNDIVDLFANTGNAAFGVHLTLNMRIISRSTKWQIAVDGNRTIGNDLLKVERAELIPFVLNSFECKSFGIID